MDNLKVTSKRGKIALVILLSIIVVIVIGLYLKPISSVIPSTQSNLVAQYQFEGNTDDGVGSNNGVLSGSPAYTTGYLGNGQGLEFGYGQDMIIPNSEDLAGSSFTAMAFVNFTDNTMRRGIFGKTSNPTSDSSNHDWEIYYDYNLDSIRASISENLFGEFNRQDLINNPPMSNWYHFAISYDGSRFIGYVDGIEVFNVAETLTLGDAHSLVIGDPNSGRDFFGVMDEIEVYDRALTGQEVLDTYLGFTGGSPAVCNDDIIEGIEVCDNNNLNLETCITQGFTGGTLTCNTDCLSFNTSACTGAPSCTDNDGDNYGIGSGCLGTDCNDGNANINPGMTEVCDGIDNNCNAQTDENNVCTVPSNCTDNDGDNYGIGAGCLGTDCNDGNANINPGATEVCSDGIDNDCDLLTDEGCSGSGTQCSEGAIGTTCECGGANYAEGWCCNDIYFDPYYIDTYGNNVCGRTFLYVDQSNPNCNDVTVTYDTNSESTPWCTLGRAAWGQVTRPIMVPPPNSEAARAGDVVIIREGTYHTTESSNHRLRPLYTPANSGNAVDGYITFKGVGGVILTSPTDNDHTTGEAIFGTDDSHSYIKFDGFTVNQEDINWRVSSGVVNIWGNYITISNCDIKGIYTVFPNGDIHNAIFLGGGQPLHDIIIENNKLHGITGSSSRNDAVITVYETGNIEIRNNEIYDSFTGIHLKRSQGYYIDNVNIHHNLFYNNSGESIVLKAPIGGKAYQNIIRDGDNAINFFNYLDNNPNRPANFFVVNNVFDELEKAVYFKGGVNCPNMDSNHFKNNIATNAGEIVCNEQCPDPNDVQPDSVDFDYNMYFQFTDFANTNPFDFSTWRTTYNQDSNSMVNVDPEYFDEASDDFRLSPGSPARDRGPDILDLDNDGNTTELINLGAYVTGDEIIGVIDWTTSGGISCTPIHEADNNPCDNCVDVGELSNYIDRWFRGEAGVTIELVAQAIDAGDSC